MVVKIKGEGTIFENSPKKTQADVKHEFVPEIRVASRILNEPETMGKFREVSSKLKQDDQRLRSRLSRSQEGKRELPPQSVMQPDELAKRVRTDAVEHRPLLLRDDKMKAPTYGLTLSEGDQEPEARCKRWVRYVFFCCWKQQ
jgi:hypothetical protein